MAKYSLIFKVVTEADDESMAEKQSRSIAAHIPTRWTAPVVHDVVVYEPYQNDQPVAQVVIQP
jgi:hypothetical protein